jgi:hypothetical protein
MRQGGQSSGANAGERKGKGGTREKQQRQEQGKHGIVQEILAGSRQQAAAAGYREGSCGLATWEREPVGLRARRKGSEREALFSFKKIYKIFFFSHIKFWDI